MHHANNEKREKTNNGRNITTKSRKHQNTRRKGNLRILGNIESEYRQTSGDERKKLKKSISGERETKLNSRNLIKGINTWAVTLGPFLKCTRDELQQKDSNFILGIYDYFVMKCFLGPAEIVALLQTRHLKNIMESSEPATSRTHNSLLNLKDLTSTCIPNQQPREKGVSA